MRRLLVVVVVAEHKTLETILALKLRRPGTSAWRQILSVCVWSKWCCNHFAPRRRSVLVVVIFASKAKHFALKKMCVCLRICPLGFSCQLPSALRLWHHWLWVLLNFTILRAFLNLFCCSFPVFWNTFFGIFSRRKLNFKSGFSCFCRTKLLFFSVKTDPF